MSEMVDRVARQINDMIANLAHPVGMGIGLPEKAAQAIAVLVIAAMRKPTETMVDAGIHGAGPTLGHRAEATWQKMIDAATQKGS